MTMQEAVYATEFKAKPAPKTREESLLFLVKKALFAAVRDLPPNTGEKVAIPLAEIEKRLVRGSPKMQALRSQWDEENYLHLALLQHKMGPEHWKKGGRDKYLLGINFTQIAINELDRLINTGAVSLGSAALKRHRDISGFFDDYTN